MGFQLHETMYGKRFFENQLPSLIRAINRLADVDEKRQAAEPAAVMKSNTVYVCYEENSHELAVENGAVNELYVASSLDDVRKWVDKQQKAAEQNFYIVLNNEEEGEFYKELIAGRETALGLYHNGEENSRLFYTLNVKPFSFSGNIFSKTTEKVRNRLRAVMADVKKSERLGKVFAEQIIFGCETDRHIGYYLAKAILDDSAEDLLAAVCGWTSKSLLDIAEFGTAYPVEDHYENNVITKKMIESGIKAKLVTFAEDPNADHGTVCRIGDGWFYFGGTEAEMYSPEEYTKNVPEERVVDEIFDVLESFRKEGKDDIDFREEYDYYWHILTYRNDM